MKLFNVLIAWDVYALALKEEVARAAVLEIIHSGELIPSHSAALQLMTAPVRPLWRDERPIVGEDINEEDFARIKGKTTQQVYDLLYKKERSK